MSGDDGSAAVVRAVRRAQRRYKTPAVSATEVTELLETTGPSTKERLSAAVSTGHLNRFEAGGEVIYWVSEENEQEPEQEDVTTDGTATNTDDNSRDAGGETSSQTWWQRQFGVGDTMLRASAVLFTLGLGTLFAELVMTVPDWAVQAGEYLFLIAIVTVLVALLVLGVTFLGERAARRGWVPAEFSVPRPW